MKKVNLVPTLRNSTVHGSITQLRKLPRSKPFQEDEYVSFKKEDTITSLSEITYAWVKATLVKKISMAGWQPVTAASTT